MKTNVSSAKGAQANKAAVLGNVVNNSKKAAEEPLLLLPTVPEVKPEVKPVTMCMSIDVLMDKADRTYLLRQKYQEIRDKRKQLEAFTISHDKNNAQLTLVDAKGLTISTSNPVSIGKLLNDWMDDLNNHLKKTEDEIRAELEAHN
jgi:hypothetical protein